MSLDGNLRAGLGHRYEQAEGLSLHGAASATTYLDDFIAMVAERGNEIAVCSDTEELTYAELYQQVVALAAYLPSVLSNVAEEPSLLGICLPRTPKLLVSMLAVQMAGHAYVPIDPEFPQQRIRMILEDAGVEVLLCSKHVMFTDVPGNMKLIQLEEIGGDAGSDSNIDSVHNETERLRTDQKLVTTRDAAERLAYVIYTSGSTGRPKGVCVSMENLSNFLRAMRERPGIDSEARVLALTTVAFDIAQLELFLPLIVGARVYIAPRETAVDGNALVNFIDNHQISLVQATPSTWQLLKLADWQGDSRLTALTGGEPIKSELAGWIAERVGALWNMYGPTETTVWSTCCKISSADISSGKIPIGHAIANTSLYVRRLGSDSQDVDSMQSCDAGEAGELLIGGLGVARGYHQRPDLNTAAFIPNQFSQQMKVNVLPHRASFESAVCDPVLYCTGDLVSVDESGRCYCHGRIDDQIKLRGYRIEPGEIENLLESIEWIERAAVSVQQHQGGDILAAYLVTSEPMSGPDQTTTDDMLDEINECLSRQLPEYMVPRMYLGIDSMPQTPNAKLDRGGLPKPGSDGVVVLLRGTSVEANTSNVAHEDDSLNGQHLSEAEKQVADMWSGLVGQPVLDSGVNFFEIGGHSLLAMRFISAARQKFDCNLPFRCMATDTLAEIASRLVQRVDTSPNSDQLKTSRTGGFIHSGKRHVFYQMHMPVEQKVKGAVLIVPPLAHEHVRIHRELFLLAEKLACCGFCVLRFDFSGTGHSALQSAELLLEDWYLDIRDAADRLRETTACGDIDVVSVRAGALLYANAGLSFTGRQIIWDPVFNGAEHIALMRDLTTSAISDLDRYRWSVKNIPTDEIMGQIYQPLLVSKLSALRWQNVSGTHGGKNLHILGGSGSINLPDVERVEGNTRQLSVSMGQLHRVPDAIDWNDPKQVDSIIVAPATLQVITDLLR